MVVDPNLNDTAEPIVIKLIKGLVKRYRNNLLNPNVNNGAIDTIEELLETRAGCKRNFRTSCCIQSPTQDAPEEQEVRVTCGPLH